MRAIAMLAAAFLTGCFGYAVRKSEGPAIKVPEKLYGVGPGQLEAKALVDAGWALADERPDGQFYVYAAAEEQVREAEAYLALDESPAQLEFVRVHYRSTRLATYQALLNSLVAAHGPPQISEERAESRLLWIDSHGDRPRPNSVVVHRWKGGATDLVLVAGLEAEENLKTAMTYQLLLVLPDVED